MCGIGGAISRSDELNPLMPLIIEGQHRRGPDFNSQINLSVLDVRIALAHNRLAILDLTESSNQPFVDPSTGACIVYNGEIYNYRELREELTALGENFITRGDTEVLLKSFLRWGPDFYQKINGMFAFAVWNPLTETLTLARDRFGVKPCYYYNRNNQFAFASTTQALARFFNPKPSNEYMSHGILYSLYEDTHGTSPYDEIQSLPPGHVLELKGPSVNIRQVYSLPDRLMPELDALDFEKALKLTDETLRSAVEVRMRSDVPITLSLSGGLDSALIASYARELSSQKFQAFSFGALGDAESESALASLTAKHLGIELHHVDLPLNRVCDTFEKVLFDQEAPFADPTVLAQNRVFEAMNRSGLRVSLGGQGADEVFMGYRKFQFFYLKELLKQNNYSRAMSVGLGIARMLASDSKLLKEMFQQRSRYKKAAVYESPFRDHSLNEKFALRLRNYPDLRSRQMADVGFASLLTLLRYEDRNSMGHSVESRMPFLDYRMIELGSSLSTEHKVKNGYGKFILRELARRRGLPKAIAFTRAKRAFSNNSSLWLNEGGLASHIESGVHAQLTKLQEVFNDSTMSLLRDPRTYRDPSQFSLVVTANWLARTV